MSLRGQILLEARGVVKTFPGVRALEGVDLRVRRGRLNALMGENGAGKSTLMKIVAGVYPADEGRVLLEGEPVAFRSTREAQEAGISMIFQELTLIENLSVAENLFLSREPLNRLGLVDFPRMEREAIRLLQKLGVDIDPARKVGSLSVALQQVVEIARALSFDAKVLILDEPTSALTAKETQMLFAVISQLKEQGVGLVYITHRFEELASIADDVTVYRDGEFVDEKPYSELDQKELVRMMIGRDAQLEQASARSGERDSLLSVKGVTLRSDSKVVVEDCSFDVGAGEIVGVFGLMGAGRTELLESLFGLHPQGTSGVVHLKGKPLALTSPEEAIKAGLALAPEDRKSAGLVLGMSIAKNITLACLDRVSRAGLLSPTEESRVSRRFVKQFNIRCASTDQQVGNLSGGNQQKVVLSKWLATEPRVLMLDEPTRGIDVGAKQEVYRLLRELAAKGMGLLVVSSEAPELIALCDRILVMCEGRMAGEFSQREADEPKLLRAALPTGALGKIT